MRRLAPVVVVMAVAACGASSPGRGSSTSASTTTASTTSASTQAGAGTIGPEGVPIEQGAILAPASSTAPGSTVDGIQCAPLEQLAYHIHVRLQVYAGGAPRALPPAVGMVGPVAQQTARGPFYSALKCIYWLHVHAGDGIIHIESPSRHLYTLGNFFDEWGQPLSPRQVAGVAGPVTAYVNRARWPRDPRDIPLVSHEVIQLDVGTPLVPFRSMSWSGLGL